MMKPIQFLGKRLGRVLLLLLFLPVSAASLADQPNILLIYVDDLGFGDLGSYGHPSIKTPNIDALARDGMMFTNYYAPSALCSPSRAAVLTGRTPYRTGIKSWIPEDSGVYLKDEEITLAEVLGAVIEAGATTVNIPDTVGYTTPYEIYKLFKWLGQSVPGIGDVVTSTHCHNDLGLAVANSLAAVLMAQLTMVLFGRIEIASASLAGRLDWGNMIPPHSRMTEALKTERREVLNHCARTARPA